MRRYMDKGSCLLGVRNFSHMSAEDMLNAATLIIAYTVQRYHL